MGALGHMMCALDSYYTCTCVDVIIVVCLCIHTVTILRSMQYTITALLIIRNYIHILYSAKFL